MLTVLLGGLVVLLAHQSPVLHQVELVARGQLPAADDAGEAVQVVDEVLGFPHHLRGGDALLARRAFGPETPARTSDGPEPRPGTGTGGLRCNRGWGGGCWERGQSLNQQSS